MNAFLAGRSPDFQKFRLRAKRELDGYLRGLEKNLNAPPVMRVKAKN
jgi:naphthoate synthase